MAELVEPLDFALRNTRVLVRRVAVASYRREPIPPTYAALLDDLAECTDAIADELAAGRAATAVRDELVALGRDVLAHRAHQRAVGRGGPGAGPVADRRPARGHGDGPVGRDRPDPAPERLTPRRDVTDMEAGICAEASQMKLSQSSRTTESTTATRSPSVRSATIRWRW